MSWVGPAIGAAGSIVGGLIGSSGASKAAKAQKAALERQIALQQQMYYANLGINEPWRAAGFNALSDLGNLFGYQTQPYQSATDIARQADVGGGPGVKLGAKAVAKMLKRGMSIEEISKLGRLKDKSKVVNKLSKYGLTADQIKTLQGGPMGLGLPASGQAPSGGAAAGGAASTPDWSVFLNSPDYQWRRKEGLRDLDNRFATILGGDAFRAMDQFNQGEASREADKYIDRRFTLAGYGQRAGEAASQYGQNFANQAGNAYANMGNARASGIANQYNMLGQGIQGAANAFGQGWDNRGPSGYSYSNGLGRYQTTPVYPGGVVPMLPYPELPPLRIG